MCKHSMVIKAGFMNPQDFRRCAVCDALLVKGADGRWVQPLEVAKEVA